MARSMGIRAGYCPELGRRCLGARGRFSRAGGWHAQLRGSQPGIGTLTAAAQQYPPMLARIAA
eukprot:2510967-Lingulodinium_polyedra.AAC.1